MSGDKRASVALALTYLVGLFVLLLDLMVWRPF